MENMSHKGEERNRGKILKGRSERKRPLVRHEFADDVSETAVGPIFSGRELEFSLLLMISEDGTHSGFRNVVGKLMSHTVQKPQNQNKKNTHFTVEV
jgi:hypothetical protein